MLWVWQSHSVWQEQFLLRKMHSLNSIVGHGASFFHSGVGLIVKIGFRVINVVFWNKLSLTFRGISST